ncbi:hypothetical protein INR49_028248 [Caranx melampygus]|nr:hypothetical protein INR49_028248 [Caranx melampygus]
MASPNDLHFQDPKATTLSMPASDSPVAAAGEDVKLDLSEDEEGQEESSELLGGQKPAGGFWTFEYYQSFFNVDTGQVLDRVKGSLLPLPGKNFIKHYLRSNPDLYVPQSNDSCSSDLHVRLACANWFMGFPDLATRAERQIGGYSFLETVCVYGYSLFIYIPTSVLWIIPFEWLRWTLILVAMTISGSVLVLTFWPVVRDDTKVTAVATIVTIVVLHTLLAIGCKVSQLCTSSSLQYMNYQLSSPQPPRLTSHWPLNSTE